MDPESFREVGLTGGPGLARMVPPELVVFDEAGVVLGEPEEDDEDDYDPPEPIVIEDSDPLARGLVRAQAHPAIPELVEGLERADWEGPIDQLVRSHLRAWNPTFADPDTAAATTADTASAVG